MAINIIISDYIIQKRMILKKKENCEKVIMKRVMHVMTSVYRDGVTFGIENGHKETLFFRWPNFPLKWSFH